MNTWIGPAIVAAVISSLISALGWFVNYRMHIGLEQRRRREKVRDLQIALHAEIRSEIYNLESYDPEGNLADIEKRYRQSETYSVTVPRPVRHIVFETVLPDVQILPAEVIDPLIVYTRQRFVIDSFVEDLRDESFREKSRELQLSMYRDYLALRANLLTLAYEARDALTASLDSDPDGINSRDGGQFDP